MKQKKMKDELELSARRHARAIVHEIVAATDNNGEIDPAKEEGLVASVASSLRGFSKRQHKRRYCTCEGCGKVVIVPAGYGIPSGWSQYGESRFRQRLADWCVECTAKSREEVGAR